MTAARAARALPVALALVLWGAAAAQAEPPPVERLFGCPLSAPQEGFRPGPGWQRLELEAVGAVVQVPADWKVERTGALVEIVSSSGKSRLVLRRSTLAGADRVEEVKRAVEAAELGPSHLGAACERALLERLTGLRGFGAARLGVYGRPLGDHRRTYAAFLPAGEATLSVLLTTRWGRSDDGPDLAVVRRVLGGLEPLPSGPPVP